MIILLVLFLSVLFSQPNDCIPENSELIYSRSLYSIGDTLSFNDQNVIYNVCNGNDNYETGDSFSFSDFNGSVNLIFNCSDAKTKFDRNFLI